MADGTRRGAAWRQGAGAGTPGTAPATLRLALEEWLDGCDGARLGRLTCEAAPRPGAPWLGVLRAAARQRGLVVTSCADLARDEGGSGPRDESRGVIVVDRSARGPADREACDWLWVALSPRRVAGLVSRHQVAPGWACLPVLASHQRASGEAPRGAAGGRPWSATPGVARDGCVARVPGRQVSSRASTTSGRAAAVTLERAIHRWLVAGLARPALHAVLRLAVLKAEAGDVVAADRMLACVEVAAVRLGKVDAEVARAVARVGARRAEAHHRAWRCLADGRRPGRARREPVTLERGIGGGGDVDDELIEVFEAGHHEEEYPAIARVCSVVRDRLGASAVAVVALGEPTPLAGAGHAPLATDDLLRRAARAIVEIAPTTGRAGVEAAMPVRFAGAPVGVLCCRWGANAAVDPPRARSLLAAAASACAPSLHALLTRRPLRHDPDQTMGLLGVSPEVGRVRDAIRRAAAVPFPVLVEGESGSGKELVARAIHQASPRQRRQFCAVNCAAISDELFEAEVFGHARGAFTGALTERAGLFEEADGGTLFLDEVGELSPRGQAKLLRVLQEGEVRRLGENLPRRVDVRLVAASNRSLEREARAGRFRDDLRFRLDVVRIALPPLRERREDVPLLAEHFWRQALSRTGGRARLDEATLDVLARHDWPGNVRELQNLMATLAVKAPARGRVRPSDLPFQLARTAADTPSLDEARRHFDASFVRATLGRCGGRRAEAARTLGLTRQGLAKLMVRLGLDTEVPS